MRRLPQVVVNPPRRIGNNKILNRRPKNIPFKIKTLLRQSKVVKLKKWSRSAKNECQKKKHLFL